MSKSVMAGAVLAAMMCSAAAMAQPGGQGRFQGGPRGAEGPMTRDQYVAMAKQRFAAMDGNGDGIVTKEEAAAEIAKRMGDTPRPQMVDRMFARIDTDGDGKATTAEAEAAAIAQFTQLDTDKNGTVTPEEMAAGRQGMMRRQ